MTDHHHLSGAYVVDAVDDDERAAFEEHLRQCADCRDEVTSLRRAALELTALTQTPPPAHLRANVLDAISTVRPEAPAPADVIPLQRKPIRASRRKPTRWIAAAVAAVAVTLGGVTVWDQVKDSSPTVSAEANVLAAPDAQRWSASVEQSRATVVRSASLGKAVLVLDHLPPAPKGHDYQAWLQMPDGSMHSAGLAAPHGDTSTQMMLTGDAADAVGFGLTMEPAGGSPQPTTSPMMLIPFT